MKTALALNWAQNSLKGTIHANSNQESFWLLRKAMVNSDNFLFSNDLSETEWFKFCSLVHKRKSGVPLAYITKETEFMGLKLAVDENTLIPRPETEVLAEKVVRQSEKFKFPMILEIGTGSGAVAVAIATRCDASIIATDISQGALSVAKKNAASHDVENKILFSHGSLYDALPDSIGRFDIICSNPPYVKRGDLNRLQLEVQNEPRIALDGGIEGLDLLFPIIDGSIKHLKKKGVLFLEIGDDQGEFVKNRMAMQGLKNIEIIMDQEGKNRVAKGEFHG